MKYVVRDIIYYAKVKGESEAIGRLPNNTTIDIPDEVEDIYEYTYEKLSARYKRGLYSFRLFTEAKWNEFFGVKR